MADIFDINIHNRQQDQGSTDTETKTAKKLKSGGPSPSMEDFDKDEKDFKTAVDIYDTEDKTAVDASNAETKTAKEPTKTGDIIQTKDDLYKSIGLGGYEEKVFSNKEKIAQAKRSRNYQLLGEAFKLLTEGAGAAAGSYTDKRETTPYIKSYYDRINKLSDADILDARRRESNRISNLIRKEAIQQRGTELEKRREDTKKYREKMLSQRKEENQKNRESRERIAGPNINNLEYIKKKNDLQLEFQKNLSEIRKLDDIEKTAARYGEAIKLADHKAGLKPGKEINVKGVEYKDDNALIAAGAEVLRKLPSLGTDEYFALPQWVKKVVKGDKQINKAIAMSLLQMYGPEQEQVDPITQDWYDMPGDSIWLDNSEK